MKNSKRCIMAILLLISTLSSILNSSSSFAAPWEPDSDPFAVNRNYSAFFSELPLKASLPDTELPWSGPYWADRKGSIAYRWQSFEKPWQYSLPSKEKLKTLEMSELALLSPAEKFDLVRGFYDFPTVAEVLKTANKHDKFWYGICTGWSQAALHFDQPQPIAIENPDGILIPFGSGDIKALASYYYAYPGEKDRVTARIGTRCDPGDDQRDCQRDVNAGAFHILLANRLGLEKKGLFADMSRGVPIQQHPIYGYKSTALEERVPSADASPLAVREVHVRTKLFYAHEAPATWEMNSTIQRTRRLNYWLELDESGQIVGGSYIDTKGGRVPDYIWLSEPLSFSHGWEILGMMISPKGTNPVPSKQPDSEIDPDSDDSF